MLGHSDPCTTTIFCVCSGGADPSRRRGITSSLDPGSTFDLHANQQGFLFPSCFAARGSLTYVQCILPQVLGWSKRSIIFTYFMHQNCKIMLWFYDDGSRVSAMWASYSDKVLFSMQVSQDSDQSITKPLLQFVPQCPPWFILFVAQSALASWCRVAKQFRDWDEVEVNIQQRSPPVSAPC